MRRDEAKCAALRGQLPDVPVIAGDASTWAANEAAVVTPSRGVTGGVVHPEGGMGTR